MRGVKTGGASAPASVFLAARPERHGRKMTDVSGRFGDLADPFLFHLVDADNRMHGNEGTLYTGKLVFQFLFGRIDHHLGALTKQKLFDFDEAIQVALINLADIDLVDLA